MSEPPGWIDSSPGILGVNIGDMVASVALSVGLKEQKKTAFVKAPETFSRWTFRVLILEDDHKGMRCE